MYKKSLLTTLYVFIAAACSSSAYSQVLNVGSQAPAIDVEHWIQDADGKLEPVTEFEKDKVYVIEFWATWCQPCLMSMPHLAQLQQQYRESGVRLISITNETVDEVGALLTQKYPQTEQTFDEVTRNYSLTADPDGSVQSDYMGAAEINAIPTSFLVGKTGLIEWIGHPMELDEPLEKVLDGSWDREAFKETRDRQDRRIKITSQMAQLAQQGKYEEAVELIQAQLTDSKEDTNEHDYWRSVLSSLKMSAGKLDEESIDYYRGKIAESKGNHQELMRFAFSVFGVFENGGSVGPLAAEGIEALRAAEAKVEPESKGVYLIAIALLHRVDGELDRAIEITQQAVDGAEGPQKQRFQQQLEAFKEEKAATEKKTESSDDVDAKKE